MGQSITASHLAPFVDVSRQKIRKRLASEIAAAGVEISEETLNAIAEAEVVKEVENGCQTIQYQRATC